LAVQLLLASYYNLFDGSGLKQCTLLSFPGDYRDDKKRRLPKGHTGELSSRLLLLDEDLEEMLASLTVDDIFDEGKSG
jgi:hypothetical protein